MKRKLVLGAVLLSLVALIASGPPAYVTEKATAVNVISTGTVSCTIKELGSDGTTTIDYVVGNHEGIAMPGSIIEKAPLFENTGSGDAYLRVRAEISVVPAEGSTEWTSEYLKPSFVLRVTSEHAHWTTA